MKKGLLKGLVLGMVITMSSSVTAFAKPGNGNDGCHVPGYETGHKDHGQSNEHKIEIGYIDFEMEMSDKGVNVVRMSNNINSNGWITYHVLDENGKQIEVVHVRGQKENVGDGTEDDKIMVDQPATEEEGDLPEIGVDFEDYPVLEGEDDMGVDFEDCPVLEGDDNIQINPEEEFPPVGEGEDNNGVDFEDFPVLEGEDNIQINPGEEFPPVLEGEDNMEVTPEELPNVGDGSEEDKMEVTPQVEEVPQVQEPTVDNNQTMETLPQTGGVASSSIMILGMLITGSGILLNKKK